MKIHLIYGPCRQRLFRRWRAACAETRLSSWGAVEGKWSDEEDLLSKIREVLADGLFPQDDLCLHLKLEAQAADNEKLWKEIAQHPKGRAVIALPSEKCPENLPTDSTTEYQSYPANRSAWLREELAEQGYVIDAELAQEVCRRTGPDFENLTQEAEKLMAYAGEEKTVREPMLAVVESTEEVAIWDWIDAVLAGKIREVQDLLDDLLAGGHAAAALYAGLCQRIVQTHQVKSWSLAPSPKVSLADFLALGKEHCPSEESVRRLFKLASSQAMAFWNMLLRQVIISIPPDATELRNLSLALATAKRKAKRIARLQDLLSANTLPEILWRDQSGAWRRKASSALQLRPRIAQYLGESDRVIVGFEGDYYQCRKLGNGYERLVLSYSQVEALGLNVSRTKD